MHKRLPKRQWYGRPMEKCEPPANQRHIIRLDLYLAHQSLGSQIWVATLPLCVGMKFQILSRKTYSNINKEASFDLHGGLFAGKSWGKFLT